jgi:hypothetical protein
MKKDKAIDIVKNELYKKDFNLVIGITHNEMINKIIDFINSNDEYDHYATNQYIDTFMSGKMIPYPNKTLSHIKDKLKKENKKKGNKELLTNEYYEYFKNVSSKYNSLKKFKIKKVLFENIEFIGYCYYNINDEIFVVDLENELAYVKNKQ